LWTTSEAVAQKVVADGKLPNHFRDGTSLYRIRFLGDPLSMLEGRQRRGFFSRKKAYRSLRSVLSISRVHVKILEEGEREGSSEG